MLIYRHVNLFAPFVEEIVESEYVFKLTFGVSIVMFLTQILRAQYKGFMICLCQWQVQNGSGVSFSYLFLVYWEKTL